MDESVANDRAPISTVVPVHAVSADMTEVLAGGVVDRTARHAKRNAILCVKRSHCAMMTATSAALVAGSVGAVVRVVVADELPNDVRLARADFAGDAEDGAHSVAEADRPDVVTGELVEA
jgi:hypothetical protein